MRHCILPALDALTTLTLSAATPEVPLTIVENRGQLQSRALTNPGGLDMYFFFGSSALKPLVF